MKSPYTRHLDITHKEMLKVTYDSTILTEAVNAHYYSEVLILVLLVLLCIVAVIASFFCFKELVGKSRKKLY